MSSTQNSPASTANPFSAVDRYAVLSPPDVCQRRVPDYLRALTSFFGGSNQLLSGCGGLVANLGGNRTCDGYCNDDAKLVLSMIRGNAGGMQIVMTLDPHYPVTREPVWRDVRDHIKDIKAAQETPGSINGLALQWYGHNQKELGTKELLLEMQQREIQLPVMINGAQQSPTLDEIGNLADEFPFICAIRIDQMRLEHIEELMELLTKRSNLSVFYGERGEGIDLASSESRPGIAPVRIIETLQRFTPDAILAMLSRGGRSAHSTPLE